MGSRDDRREQRTARSRIKVEKSAYIWGKRGIVRGFTEIGYVPKSRVIYKKEPLMPV